MRVGLLLALLVPPSTSQVCWKGEEAAREVRGWALAGTEEERFEIAFYETVLDLVRRGEGPSWYLVAGGWQGAFYYEGGQPGEERVGAYLYPDFLTAVVGVWQDHLLLRGRVTSLGEACHETKTGWKLMFTDPVGPTIAYSPPTHHSLGVSDHSLSDPYEARTVVVKPSLQPGAQDGLFTLREVQAGEVLAFYSGFIIHCESNLRALDRRELGDELEHERNMYNIALDIGEEDQNLCIDLPPELGNDVTKYRATLGHKVNHSFEPNCEFVLLSSHPVLGTVMGLAALRDITADQELRVNYGYNVTSDPDQPAWFVKLWHEFYKTDPAEPSEKTAEKDEL